MRNKITRYRGQPTNAEWLRLELTKLTDDLSRNWTDYPCLEWPFHRNIVSGYGYLSFEGTPTPAHRVALILTLGDLGEMDSCHHCDNPPCFRPIHLFAGDAKANAADMVRKGRNHVSHQSVNVGGDHFNARLTDAKVYQARLDFAAGKSRYEIASELDICQSGIDKMLRGDTWKHVLMVGPSTKGSRPYRSKTHALLIG